MRVIHLKCPHCGKALTARVRRRINGPPREGMSVTDGAETPEASKTLPQAETKERSVETPRTLRREVIQSRY